MLNGCPWHEYKGCRYATKLKPNVEFGETKIPRDRHCDDVTVAHLRALGRHVITIWECELRPGVQLQNRLDNLAEEIRHEGDLKMVLEDERRRRMCTPNKFRMAETMCRILLRAEASSLYSIQKVVQTLYEIY